MAQVLYNMREALKEDGLVPNLDDGVPKMLYWGASWPWAQAK